MGLRIGTRIGKYELLQRLGAGAMGEVYRARDHDLGRDIAIKFLPERLASDTERLARFAKEARAASSLNHPNIVTIHEIGRADSGPFLVMEYIEGQTLRQLLRGKPLSPKQILDIAVQISDGLVKAHAAGIVHRDLKPENIMITPDGLVKILDFGLAKLYQRDAISSGLIAAQRSEADTLSLPQASSEGIIVGTVGYMSPEQASGHTVDFRSDQFALGAILYEMATGRRAFQRNTPVQTLSATIDTQPEPLTSLNTSFPAPARWTLERCLSKDPKDRYASTADLALELRNVREHLSEVSTLGKEERVKRISIPSRGWLVFGLAAAVFLALFTVSSFRENVLEKLHLLSIPSEKRIAVLPFRYTGSDDNDRLLCDGLLSYMTERLSQLKGFQKNVWVVPALEVRESGVVSPETARRSLDATIVVDGSLQRTGGRLVLSARLVDAHRLRQLRSANVEIPVGKASLLQEAVNAVVGMLDLELRPEEQTAMRGGQTGVVEASTAYGQALGYTAYRQGRTALERYEQQQNLERAVSLFNEALRRDPRYALAHAGLGEAYWRLSRFTRNEEHVALAEEHCRRALDLDDTLAEAWITLGILHTGTGRAEDAVKDLTRAIDRDPRNAEAYREQANAYRKLNREADAEATYQKAIALQPDSWITHSYFGGYLAGRGRPAEAEKEYLEALRLVPDNARVWSGLGSACYLQQKYPAAEDAWRKSLELHATSTAASNLALHPFYEGRYSEAALRLERAVKIDNRDYRVWRNLAAACYWAPDGRQRAVDAYKHAAVLAEKEHALDPADARILAELADCYAMLGEPSRALEYLVEAERLGGNQVLIVPTIADVYEQLGNRKAALKWIAAALKLNFPRDEIERDPWLARLRMDPEYAAIVRQYTTPGGVEKQ